MTSQEAVDLITSGAYEIILIVSVIIVPGLLVGLLVSIFQAATQINEQTLSFLPKLLVTVYMVAFAGPWILMRLLTEFEEIFAAIPVLIG